MYQQVKALKEGKSVDKPIYNHVTGKLDAPETIQSPKMLVRHPLPRAGHGCLESRRGRGRREPGESRGNVPRLCELLPGLAPSAPGAAPGPPAHRDAGRQAGASTQLAGGRSAGGWRAARGGCRIARCLGL
jgi:hypothetical protein